MTNSPLTRAYTELPVSTANRLLISAIVVLGFAALTAACAQVSFWIGPVPVTGQTLGVLLAGLFLGSRKGALSQLSYIVIGMTGIPFWFAPGGAPGIMRLAGPTGGYLIGFVFMAFIAGWLFEKVRSKRIWHSIIAAFAGTVVLYVSGLSWLSMYVPASHVLSAGLFPFIIGDLIKIVAAALFVHTAGFVSSRVTKAHSI